MQIQLSKLVITFSLKALQPRLNVMLRLYVEKTLLIINSMKSFFHMYVLKELLHQKLEKL